MTIDTTASITSDLFDFVEYSLTWDRHCDAVEGNGLAADGDDHRRLRVRHRGADAVAGHLIAMAYHCMVTT